MHHAGERNRPFGVLEGWGGGVQRCADVFWSCILVYRAVMAAMTVAVFAERSGERKYDESTEHV